MKTFFAVILAVALASGTTRAQVAVIAHPSVDETSLTLSAVSDIYTLTNTLWSDRSSIVVVDIRPDLPAKRQFYAGISKDPATLRKAWMRIVLAGEAKAPSVVDTEDEILQRVSTTRGAIGYISASKVTSAVKVLAKVE